MRTLSIWAQLDALSDGAVFDVFFFNAAQGRDERIWSTLGPLRSWLNKNFFLRRNPDCWMNSSLNISQTFLKDGILFYTVLCFFGFHVSAADAVKTTPILYWRGVPNNLNAQYKDMKGDVKRTLGNAFFQSVQVGFFFVLSQFITPLFCIHQTWIAFWYSPIGRGVPQLRVK